MVPPEYLLKSGTITVTITNNKKPVLLIKHIASKIKLEMVTLSVVFGGHLPQTWPRI